MKKTCLDLFTGTGSIGKVFERNGYEVISLDILSKFNPTICCDIMNWDYKSQYQPKYFDFIWASPPCQYFSTGRNIQIGRNGYTRDSIYNDMIEKGLPPLIKALEIIKYFKPKYYCIENPQSGKMKQFLDLPYTDCAYCQYGLPYRKNTRIWNNFNLKLEKCKCKGRHEASIMGNKFISREEQKRCKKTEDLYIIPSRLVEIIYEQVSRRTVEES